MGEIYTYIHLGISVGSAMGLFIYIYLKERNVDISWENK